FVEERTLSSWIRSRIVWLAVVLAALIIALGGVLISYFTSLSDAEANQTVAPVRTIPHTDVNPFGAGFFLDREVEDWKREETVKMAAEAGIGWAKQQFVWAEIEPQPGAAASEDWGKWDDIVDLCARYNIQIIARLDRTPAWARPSNPDAGAPPDDFTAYGDFVYRFIQHYRGQVRYLQVWNEPNLSREWGNQPVDPAAYVELLKVAYQAAKSADPNVVVLSAPLAITLGEPHPDPGKWSAMSDLQFLEEMYLAGAAPYFDVLSVNAFGMDRTPEDPADPNVLNFQRVALQREIMERHGDGGKAVWFNEYGWNAAPASFPDDKLIWKRVSEEEQAAYTLRGIEMARSQWPWAGVFNIWYFRQVGNIPADDAEYYFRVVDVDFTPRRVYYAVKDATAGLRVAGIGTFEETSPAVTADQAWQEILDERASGQTYLESDTPGASLTFTFKGSEVDLIAIRDYNGGRLLVTLDGHRVSGLPTDSQGRSYVELFNPDPQWKFQLPLVRGVGNGNHILRLTVSDEPSMMSLGARCAVDALQVRSAARPFPLWPVSLLSLGILVAGGLLRREVQLRRRYGPLS
ncbi:MAG: hypothetical protein SVX38_16215, partial [Chloroflexota bacterium]|nr:hypothetical protein [Chloroflexota bacterium]